MKCPFCGHLEDKVVDSRITRDGEAVRRRRECLGCEARFTTYERRRRECLGCEARFTTYEYVERIPVTVVKADGRRESYNREKILGGLLRACEKRPVPREELERLVEDLERRVIFAGPGAELTSKRIGEAVMRRLRELDEVAYVRFASVYRRFADLSQFTAELDALLDRRDKRKGKQ